MATAPVPCPTANHASPALDDCIGAGVTSYRAVVEIHRAIEFGYADPGTGVLSLIVFWLVGETASTARHLNGEGTPRSRPSAATLVRPPAYSDVDAVWFIMAGRNRRGCSVNSTFPTHVPHIFEVFAYSPTNQIVPSLGSEAMPKKSPYRFCPNLST